MTRANLYFATDLWQVFRGACIRRGTSASKEFVQFMREQLAAWGEDEAHHTREDTHA